MDDNMFREFIKKSYGCNITYDGKFISLRKTPRLTFHCSKTDHNEPFSLRTDWVLKHKTKNICPFCNGKYNTAIIKSILYKKFGDHIQLISNWNCLSDNMVKTNLIFKCKIHGEFTEKLNNVLHYKYGCSKCAYDKANDKKHQKPINDLKKKLEPFNIIFNESDYKNVNTPIDFYKITNGKSELIFKRTPGKILYDDLFSVSEKSAGEQFLKSVLNDLNIKYTTQHTFPDLKYIRNLKLDFFIEEKRVIIEYDGPQHKNKNSLFYDENGEIRDAIKDEYALNNNLRVLRIFKKDNHRLSKNKKILVSNKIKEFLESSTTIEIFEI